MSTFKKSLDFLIYGATGFTGKEIVRYFQHFRPCTDVRWGICGRSIEKLEKLKLELGFGDEIPILIADVNDTSSLHNAFSAAKVVLNCTGPYRFLGEPVVNACIESNANYMDICGEPQFIEDMYLKYHDKAISAKVLIMHACAFDSVPADLGFLFATRQFTEGAECRSVESFLSINTGNEGLAAHYTTYECAVHGMGDVDSLRKIRKDAQDKYKPPKVSFKGDKLKRVSGVEFDERANQYIIPFMGADAAIVKSTSRSIAMMKEPPCTEMMWPQYAAYACIGQSWSSVAAVSVYGGMFGMLSGFDYGRSTLLAYPEFFSGGIFSHAGPNPKQLAETSFSMRFLSVGVAANATSEIRVETVVEGPEPGYVATPIIFVTLALNLLRDQGKTNSNNKAIFPTGGVYTPGAAYYHSESIIDELIQVGIVFKRIS